MFVRVNFDQPVNELIQEFLTEEYTPLSSSQPAIDVTENKNESLIVAELPGVEKEDISIAVENGWLTLKGERKETETADVKRILHREIEYVPFSRAIKLPHAVDVNSISAELTNGILKISLPKAEEIRSRTIEIK
jgi:HSP20 family protein